MASTPKLWTSVISCSLLVRIPRGRSRANENSANRQRDEARCRRAVAMNQWSLETNAWRGRGHQVDFIKRNFSVQAIVCTGSTHGNSRTLVSLHEFPRPLLTVAKHAPLHTGIDSSFVDSGLSISNSRLCCPRCKYYIVDALLATSRFDAVAAATSVERDLKNKVRECVDSFITELGRYSYLDQSFRF